jgi:hypothetical protein
MVLGNDVVQEVKDMFNIDYSQDNVQDDAQDNVEVSVEPFKELEQEVSDIISGMEDKGDIIDSPAEDITEIAVERSDESKENNIENNNTEESKVETIEDLIADSVEEASLKTKTQDQQDDIVQIDIEEDCFDSIVIEKSSSCETPSSEEKIETSPKEEVSVIEEEDIDIIPQKDDEGNVKGELKMKNVVSISVDDKGKTIIRGGEIVWSIESPSELYDSFYNIKRNHIDTFSGGEQLDFDSLYAELFGAKVDTSTEVLDQYILVEKMDAVMQCIERVAMIQVQINQQHFVWKRFVELLRGALARVQYLKPVLKQDGLILEHMGDVEFYSDRLLAIKNSANDVMGTLEKAFESLSRKVSIMLTVQSKHVIRTAPDAYGQSSQQTYQAPPPSTVAEESPASMITPTQNLGDYDGFEIGTKVASTRLSSGVVSWGEVF